MPPLKHSIFLPCLLNLTMKFACRNAKRWNQTRSPPIIVHLLNASFVPLIILLLCSTVSRLTSCNNIPWNLRNITATMPSPATILTVLAPISTENPKCLLPVITNTFGTVLPFSLLHEFDLLLKMELFTIPHNLDVSVSPPKARVVPLTSPAFTFVRTSSASFCHVRREPSNICLWHHDLPLRLVESSLETCAALNHCFSTGTDDVYLPPIDPKYWFLTDRSSPFWRFFRCQTD